MRHMREKHNVQKLKVNSLKNDEGFEQQECCKKILKKNLNRHLKNVHGFTPKQIANSSIRLTSIKPEVIYILVIFSVPY